MIGSFDLFQLIVEHISISLISLFLAILIGIPLGYYSYKNQWLGKITLLLTQGLRVIPSLAVLFIIIPIIGVGKIPAIIALVFLGIPPIAINTRLGFVEVSPILIETGKSLGMNKQQLLRKVQIPIAYPFILVGIKLTLIEIISSATLATYIGAGGLGTLIYAGLGLYRFDLLISGAGLVALLSIAANLLMESLIKRRKYT